jgi:hypothetical protein
MRTSLNEIALIDKHIFDNGTREDAILFEAMLILDTNLPGQVMWQKKAHVLVLQYGRKKLKEEIALVHDQLFTRSEHQSFRQRIFTMFYRQ